MDSLVESLLVQLVDRLPRSAISRAFGAASEVRLPRPIQASLNEVLSTIVGIDRSEAIKPPSAYETINGVFTRRLRPGARPIDSTDPGAVVSPVDGTLTRFGRIRDDTLFEVKGRRYGVTDIVADGVDAALFEGGQFAIFYLSPRDYHRIHSPTAGRIERFRYLPGYLFPVNEVWVRNVDNLFAANERIVSFFETDGYGTIGFAKIGAACVGRTTLAFHEFETSDHDKPPREIELDEPVEFSHGDEVGAFNLGSTVLLLFEERGFEFAAGLEEGATIRMGRLLGRFDGQ